MKEKKRNVIIIAIILIIIIGALVYAYDIGGIKNSLESIRVSSVSSLDLIKNPMRYSGKNIIIHDAFLTDKTVNFYNLNEWYGKAIASQEEDGNWVYLRYYYYRNIYCDGYVDLTGTVEKSGSDYYFNVTKAVCK